MITGIVQTTKTNDYGYTSYKVSSTWYGADSKGPPRASEGEKVQFEWFDKPGKEGRTFPTIKLATFKKIAANSEASAGGNANAATSAPATKPAAGGAYNAGSRDTYWADKAKSDEAKQPQIAYQAAYERALGFTDLALKNGAFDALAKAKPTDRLEILQAFVDEQAERIMKAVYAAEVPTASKEPKLGTNVPETEEAEEETWS